MSLQIPGFPYSLQVRGPLFFLLTGLAVYSLGLYGKIYDPIIDLVLAPVALVGMFLGIGQFFIVPIAVYRASRAGHLARIEVQLALCCGVGYYFVTASLQTLH